MTLPVHGAPHCLRSLEPVLRQRRGSRREREGRTSVSPLPSTLRLHLRNLGNLSGKCDHDQDLILHFSIIGELRNLLGQLRWQTIGLDTFRKLAAPIRWKSFADFVAFSLNSNSVLGQHCLADLLALRCIQVHWQRWIPGTILPPLCTAPPCVLSAAGGHSGRGEQQDSTKNGFAMNDITALIDRKVPWNRIW